MEGGDSAQPPPGQEADGPVQIALPGPASTGGMTRTVGLFRELAGTTWAPPGSFAGGGCVAGAAGAGALLGMSKGAGGVAAGDGPPCAGGADWTIGSGDRGGRRSSAASQPSSCTGSGPLS